MSQNRTDRVKDLAVQVDRLSRLLTRDRQQLSRAYLKDKGLRDAYRAYFLLPNLAKMQVLLQELSLHPRGLPGQDRLRVLDLGTGPGTALLGVVEFFKDREHAPLLECLAVDHVAENLAVAAELFHEHCAGTGLRASLRTAVGSVDSSAVAGAGRFDLIILSNVLNELFGPAADRTEKRRAFMDRLLTDQLDDQGSCIIIEPALRETSRDLLTLRDGLAGRGFTIYGPCLHQQTCPCLSNPKDWCHEDIPWDPPALIQEVDRLIGLRKDSLKFSWLVLRKDKHTLSDLYQGQVFRVVSEPLVSKGKLEFYVCGSGSRRIAMRQDKDRTPANEAFDRLRRGAVVVLQGLVDEGKRYKVSRDTLVSVCLTNTRLPE